MSVGSSRIRPPLALLDVAGLACIAATFLQLGHPDVLFHLTWLVLAAEAFLFGLRPTIVRIVVATFALLAYAMLASGAVVSSVDMQELDLVEWPVVFTISILVAVLADRSRATGQHYAALYRAASDRLLTALEDERRRISLDLHDGVGQTLTALVLTLDAADGLLEDDDHRDGEQARTLVARGKAIATRAIDETRATTLRLVPARITSTGLAAAIRELAAGVTGPVEVAIDQAAMRPGLLPAEHELIVYRIVQEALANALRHAEASRITIGVTLHDDRMRVLVADDGRGFNIKLAGGRGLGLAGMGERAAMIHATLRVRSRPGHGTAVQLSVPLAASASRARADSRLKSFAARTP